MDDEHQIKSDEQHRNAAENPSGKECREMLESR